MHLLIVTLLLFCFDICSAANIQAKSWLIADNEGKIMESENIEIIQPIASITKLMTAMVVLDSNPNLSATVTKKIKGLTVTKKQLIDLAIVKSDNTAAKMLCETYHKGYHGCINDMNLKAQILGMDNTRFEDSSGLDNRNVSTPRDLIKLLLAAERYPEIVYASNQISINLMKKKKRKLSKLNFTNTNPLVGKYNVIVSKTGYVRASGGCLVMSAIIDGKKKLYIILNSKTTRTRIHDMESLILMGIENRL
jgi:D-alanyl-D-alanine endopeptidase (penicillin-binding protein 7)